VTCLVYHRVDNLHNNSFLTRGGSPVIPPDAFAKEMLFFIKIGAKFFTFKQLMEGKFPKPDECGFIISFDDCFLDNYTNGLEVLERLGIKAVFFQTTALVDAKDLLWEHAIYWHMRDEKHTGEFKELAYRIFQMDPKAKNFAPREFINHLISKLSLSQIEVLLNEAKNYFHTEQELRALAKRIYPNAGHLREAHALGHEIGSHGHRHLWRPWMDGRAFEDELDTSSRTLEHILKEKPLSFSYPFNGYIEADEQLCAKYFSYVATVNCGRIDECSNRRSLPRFSWPGFTNNPLKQRRWLLTGTF